MGGDNARDRAATMKGSEKVTDQRPSPDSRPKAVLTPHRSVWSHSPIGVPGEALGDEVDEELVVRLEHLSERLCARTPTTALRIDDWSRRTGRVCAGLGVSRVCLAQYVTLHSPKKRRLRVLRSTRYLSGSPMTSMIQASCSCSFSPGKIGYPVYISAMMQPSDHI